MDLKNDYHFYLSAKQKLQMMKKINNNNYQCLNAPNESYTKKEQSPKGMGISAVNLPVGHEQEGVDKQIWVVHYKNNKKAWFRKNGMPLVSHEEPLLTDETIHNTQEPKTIIQEPKTIIQEPKTIIQEPKTTTNQEPKTNNQEKKITDYNYFYKYYSTKLKDENNNKNKNERKSNKDLQTEIFEEWNRLKKNKNELEELLKVIKK